MIASVIPAQRGETNSGRFRNMLIAFGAFSALALALTTWRYFTPLSGITGASGALLAMFGEFALIFAAVLLMITSSRGLYSVFVALSWLGGILTFIALLFLHGWLAAVALVLALLALAAAMVTRR